MNPRPTLERVWIVYLVAVLAANVLAGDPLVQTPDGVRFALA